MVFALVVVPAMPIAVPAMPMLFQLEATRMRSISTGSIIDSCGSSLVIIIGGIIGSKGPKNERC